MFIDVYNKPLNGVQISSKVAWSNQYKDAGQVFTVPARLLYPVCGWHNMFYATELNGLNYSRYK